MVVELMNNSEYWEKRIAENTWRTYNSLEEKNRALLEMYQEASLSISDELYRITEKINRGKGVSLSDMYKMDRLGKLQKNFENTIKTLGENVESFGKESMREGFKDIYSNVMAELGQLDYALPKERLMEEMLNRPWQGSNFSERLWKNTQVLASNLNDLLVSGLTQGKTVTEMAIQLNNRMNEGFNVSHRLVRTETMHYLNESAFKAYEDGRCKEVQIWAAIDERTCPTCGRMHGRIYKLRDRPSLPLHANCRCTYLPVIDMKSIQENNKNKVSNTGNSGIIKENPNELLREGNNRRDGFKFISDTTFNDLTIKARKNGALIIRGTKEVEEHLDIAEAAASIVGDVLLFREEVCISEVLEETYHFEQNLKGLNNDKCEPLRSILNEIDAKEYLLRNASKFKIPRKEIEITKEQLESYKNELQKLKRGE